MKLSGGSVGTSGSIMTDGRPSDPGSADSTERRAPILDLNILDQLDRLDPDGGLVEELADQFLTDARCQVLVLHRAVADGDVETLRRSAHTLKGSGANLGAVELTRLCSLLATTGAPLDTLAVGPIVVAIDTELDRVGQAFAARAPVR